MSKQSIELLGKYTCTLPPSKKGAGLIEYLIDMAQEYADEDGYTLACIVPLKPNKKEGTIDILIYVQD